MEFHGEGPPLETHHYFLAFYEVILNSFAIVLNLCLCGLLFIRPKTLIEKPRNLFLLNLAIWDIAFATLCMIRGSSRLTTLKIYQTYSECQLEGLVSEWIGMNSLVGLTLLALDRYVILVHERKMTLKFQLWILVLVNLLNAIAGVSPVFFGTEAMVIQPSGYYCLLDLSLTRPTYVTMIIFPSTVYTLNLILIVYFYSRILRAVYKAVSPLQQIQRQTTRHSSQVTSSMRSTSRSTTSSPKSSHERKEKEEEEKRGISFLFLFFHSCKTSMQHKLTPLMHEISLDTTSFSGSQISGKATLQAKRRSRSYEIQLAFKTVLMGVCHIVLYVPFGIEGYMQVFQVKSLTILDSIGLCCIELCFCLDPFLVLFFDREMVKRKKEVWEYLKKAVQR